MDTPVELVQDEMESEAETSWKDMFSKAIESIKGLEKEISHKEWEIQILKSRVKELEAEKVDPQFPPTALFDLNEELQPSPVCTRDQESHMNELNDMKLKLEATEAYLHQSLELNVKLEEEKNKEKQQQAVLTAAFDGLKGEVEAVLTATEAFKAEAVHSMQALTSDVRRYQAASDQKLQSLRAKVEKMQAFQSVQSGVLRTIAGEQKVLRQICVARAAMQQTTTASLQHLSHLEQICGTKIQKAFTLVDTGKNKGLDNSHQVPAERMELLEGVSKKHKKELSEAEKKLAGHTSSRRLGQGDDIVDMERGSMQRNEEHQKLLSLMEGQILLGNSLAGVEAEETSTSAGTSPPQESCRPVDSGVARTSPEQTKRKFEGPKQQTLRDMVAKRSPLPLPTRQEKVFGVSPLM